MDADRFVGGQTAYVVHVTVEREFLILNASGVALRMESSEHVATVHYLPMKKWSDPRLGRMPPHNRGSNRRDHMEVRPEILLSMENTDRLSLTFRMGVKVIPYELSTPMAVAEAGFSSTLRSRSLFLSLPLYMR
jgi:hypothetical protein